VSSHPSGSTSRAHSRAIQSASYVSLPDETRGDRSCDRVSLARSE
jgi:hypothetical protein